MIIRQSISMLAAAVIGALLAGPAAAQVSAGPGLGWSGEFEHAARQISQLAEAIPADTFAWQPGPSARSTAEVCMHIALGNHLLLGQAGAKSGVDLAKLGKEPEKAITGKDEVIEFLKGSFDAVRTGVPTVDRTKPAK